MYTYHIVNAQLSPNMIKKRRDAKIRILGEARPFLEGSLSKVGTKCGKENCHCTTGEKHPAFILTYKVRGKTKTIYVPKDLVEEVKLWTQEYRRVKLLIKEISSLNQQLIKSHVQRSRAVAKNERLLNQ